jgi:uncharacterized protein (TIGR02678 family)
VKGAKKRGRPDADSRSIGLHLESHIREDICTALRALLMTPLMTATHPEFAAVRRHATLLQDWFARETGWQLQVGRDHARLYKRPGDLSDDTRGLPGYDRRRYVLLCLGCAVLERAEPQITLKLLGDRVLALAADDMLACYGFTFTLHSQHERRELVAVCSTLLELGVLSHVAGDEEAYIKADGAGIDHTQDALYDIRRGLLTGMLAAVRGPSTWLATESPVTFDQRLQSLVAEHVPDNDEGQRTALRHALSRRLLDDPVVYFDSLDEETHAYFVNQRGVMATRLADAAGLVPEQRAEGVALIDESAGLTDLAMPSEGTDAHITLLVAEFIAARQAQQDYTRPLTTSDIARFILEARPLHGNYWRKSAREPGSEQELACTALAYLHSLQLIALSDEGIRPLPAVARFAAGTVQVVAKKTTPPPLPLFEAR